MREAHPGHDVSGSPGPVVARQAVFLLGLQLRGIRQGTEHFKARRVWLEPMLRIGKQSQVAAKTVDDGAQATRPVGRREQAPHAGELSEYSAAVDVADEDPAPVQVAAGTQINQVPVQEIQL